jgi:uncharacterized membrane protein
MFYAYLWYFFLYAFLGWCCEVCFAAVKNGTFVNRGFLNGPVCPIYGVGVVIVVYCLTPLKDNILVLFVGSVVLTSALEWLTGFVLEKVFHQKWWDYSSMPGNLGGYICPMFSLIWGFACLLVMKVFHPMIAGLVHLLPHTLGVVLLCFFWAVMAADVAATVATIAKLNKKLSQLDELAGRIKSASNSIGENLADGMLTLEEKAERQKAAWEEKKAELDEQRQARAAEAEERRAAREAALARREAALAELRAANEQLLSTYHFGQRRLLRAFPDMHSVHHREALEEMKEKVLQSKKKR